MLLAPRHLSLLFSLFSVSLVSAENKPCTLAAPDGKYYDLSPLKANKDYIVANSNEKMHLNVCRRVAAELVGDNYEEEVGGYIDGGHGSFSIGRVNTNLSLEDDRVRMSLSDGTKCSNSNDKASAKIDFKCDRTVFGSGTPKLIASFPSNKPESDCAFMIEWNTHFACPTAPPSGPWGLFAVLAVTIVALLSLYLILGTLYNRFVLHLTGFDQIPSFTWEGFRWHVSEMLDLARDWFRGSEFGRSYAGYQRHYNESERGQMGGRWGVRTPGSASATAEPNPWSHQAAVPGGGGSGGGGFVRPTSKSPLPQTNPVSHFSQSQSQPQGPPQPPPKDVPSPKPSSPSPPGNKSSGEEEGRELGPISNSGGSEFALGDEDDDELMKTPPGPKAVSLPSTNAASEHPDSEDKGTGGGAIRL